MAWQANHDIQFVLNAYSCVMYICDLMTRALKGMSTLMAEDCKEAKDWQLDIKTKGFSNGKQIPKSCRITSNGGTV